MLGQCRRQPRELNGVGLTFELVEGALDVDRVPIDDRVGDEVQAVRLGGLALERMQTDGAVMPWKVRSCSACRLSPLFCWRPIARRSVSSAR